MPLLPHSTFTGHRLLKGRHLETLLPALFRRIAIHYKRTRMTTSDGDFIDLDWLNTGNDRLIILFHGLEGSSQSGYIKGFARFFHQHGFDVCAVNFRGCSGEDNRLLRSYHSGASSDIAEIIQHVVANHSYGTLVMAGFSLGGNMLLKYLGEQGAALPARLKCAVAFSVPCDLAGSAAVLARPDNNVYMQRFLKTLKQKIRRKAAQFPGQVDITGIDEIKDFKAFDDRYTAPMHGFKDADDYWTKCSAKQFIPCITIPTLLVNAQNDPFLSAGCFPYDEAAASSCMFLETPAYGGHVGFSILLPNGMYWSENRAFEFIRRQVEKMN